MRLNECQQVKETLAEHLGISLTVVDASNRFLGALKGVVDSEKKRKIIGGLFIDIFEEEAVRIEKDAVNTPNAGKVEWVCTTTNFAPNTQERNTNLRCLSSSKVPYIRMSSRVSPSRVHQQQSR